jgi:hypothetical protein
VVIKESRKVGRTTLYKINLENEGVRALRIFERSISLKIAEDEQEK